MGYKARNKQPDPLPLEQELKRLHKEGEGKRKPKKSAALAKATKKATKKTKQSRPAKAQRDVDEFESDDDDDDIRGLEEQDSYDEAEDEDQDLEAARTALFDDADLRPPTAADGDDEDDEDLMDDEFDLDRADDDDDDDSDETPEGVTADEFDSEEQQDGPSQFRIPILDQEMEGADEGEEEEEDEEDEDGLETMKQGILTDLRAVEKRMRSTARILSNWKQHGQSQTQSRAELRQQMVEDICQYHGFTPFLAEKLFDIFSASEALEFFTASDTPRPLTIRVNTLKTRRKDLAQALINRGVNLEPLEGGWSKVGLQIFSGNVPIGATPEYLAGHYILQAASSFLPVMALDPQPNERCLDMSAAPGGKTTYMSAMMGNTGQVWANDSSRGRIKGLSGNIARLGCKNVVVTNVDGREFPKMIGGFDRVLLDAPCSGTGVISKDQSVKINKVRSLSLVH